MQIESPTDHLLRMLITGCTVLRDSRFGILRQHCPGNDVFGLCEAKIDCSLQTSPSTGSDTPIVDEPTSLLCQNCTLDTLNIQMTSPFGWDASLYVTLGVLC